MMHLYTNIAILGIFVCFFGLFCLSSIFVYCLVSFALATICVAAHEAYEADRCTRARQECLNKLLAASRSATY